MAAAHPERGDAAAGGIPYIYPADPRHPSPAGKLPLQEFQVAVCCLNSELRQDVAWRSGERGIAR